MNRCNPATDVMPASVVEQINREPIYYRDDPSKSEGLRVMRNPYPGDAIYVGKKFSGTSIAVGTSPVLILNPPSMSTFMLVNPQMTALTTTVSLASGMAVTGIGDSKATPINVAGVENVHLLLDISDISGTWDLWLMTYDDISKKWADAQQIQTGVSVIGTYYIPCGNIGIASKIAVRWQPSAPGSISFTIGAVRKQGLGGSVESLQQVIYIGGRDVNPLTGYPLLESQHVNFILEPNIELYAMANLPLNLTVFQLL